MASFNSNAAIDAYYQGQKAPVNAQIETAGNDYQAALARLEQNKKTQDAENYRSYVRQQNELPGLMRASGNNGGMVDSAVASLANAYNQARANRAMEFETNKANQDLDYNNRLATLRAQLAQYDQQAAAAKADLAAKQVSARARARAAETPTEKAKTTNTKFYDDYQANSRKNQRNIANQTIDDFNSGKTNDVQAYQNAVMNKIKPKNGYPTPNYTESPYDLQGILQANREVDPFNW